MGDSSNGLGVFIVKFCDQFVSSEVRQGFPAVMCVGKSLPSHEVL
jgi:hypothetical protein